LGNKGYEDLSNEKAKQLIDQGVSIIDVRDQGKYDEAHVPGARLVPLNDILADPAILPDGDILFVCNIGRSSGVASQMAVASGRTGIFNLRDGTEGWVKDGFPVEGELS
tara:strand:+ start:875 stop:1201 length:327 start_codon:yes stop_codon:yes gene_type:complete